MGIYLNPQNIAFAESVNSEIYVDKSGLIAYTNQVLGTEQKNICVTRPRRFGKSMAAKMLAAYYSCGCDSSKLFQNLQIASHSSYQTHLNQYKVIFLNIQDFLSRSQNAGDIISLIQELVLRDLKEEYDFMKEQENDLIHALEMVSQKTGSGFIVILDEWDCLFRYQKIWDTFCFEYV